MKKAEGTDAVLQELVELLDLVVREQLGNSLADKIQKIQSLSLERRAGMPDAGQRLVDEFDNLEPEEMASVIRWLSLFFDLANLTEEKQRIDVLKQRELAAREKGQKRNESIGATIFAMRDKGMSAEQLQEWLDRLWIEPVFTAHPSEAKRRTIRQLLRQIRTLIPLYVDELTDSVRDELMTVLTVLWQSDFFRPGPPPVMNEVSRGVYFASTLWDVVPKTFNELRVALKEAFPQHEFNIPRFLSFGSWIGGDRDGHPFVTAEITKKSLARLRSAAIDGHIAECKELFDKIVVSDEQIPCDTELRERLDTFCTEQPEFANSISHVSKFETSRRYIRMMQFRLAKSHEYKPEPDGIGYHSANEFVQDLKLLKSNLQDHKGQRIVERFVQPWLDLAQTFGFHFARLDIRQNSEQHKKCIDEILRSVSGQSIDEISSANLYDVIPERVDLDKLSEESREVFNTFVLIAEELTVKESHAIGCYIISMTHSANDVLNVLWLWKTAWKFKTGSESGLPHLQIVPLFETIEDLRDSAQILQTLFSQDQYKEYLAIESEQRQMVMVGYSDSTKDGGYLSACWELHKAQVELVQVSEDYKVKLTFFHGRGGALGRGGGPAARAIQSLPPKAVGGNFRVTEQGEVLSERYDDPDIAHRHLEQLICATMLVSSSEENPMDADWSLAMENMSNDAKAAYRELIEHEGFLNYFDQSTPINEIETLPIGSRPARRGKRNSLDDLRAIPWTFAWTQSRHILPAWFGLGTAFAKFVDSSGHDWEFLKSMYSQWSMFRALIDNAELALAKADIGIAKFYAEMSTDEASNQVWQMISSEYEKSKGAILMIKSQKELLEEIAWLRRSVMKRNPYVDPLNLMQVKLIKTLRENPDNQGLLKLIRLSIQGVAAGLRTTG